MTIPQIKKLHQKKYRYEHKQFLVEGIKGVQEALEYAKVLCLVVDINREEEQDIRELMQQAAHKNIQILAVGKKDYNKIKSTDTFPGILAAVQMPHTSVEQIRGHVVCVESINDPGNLGTIIRTADWFGIEHILLSSDCVDPYNDKVVRSSMGSIFHVQLHHSKQLLKDLSWLQKENNYRLLGLALDGTTISNYTPGKQDCYVFGSESHGLSAELEKMLDARYTIPGKGRAESLNVAIAAGIVLSQI